MQFKRLLADGYGMPGIIPAIETSNIISFGRKQVHKATFTFIPPLGANDDV
jgi:hypothetical protein